jgi:NAD(P)-dependent dehydrogenase (short-subunit alcohol dehydrogenase family)
MNEPSRSRDLANKTCLIIGGGSIAPGWGIGKAIAVAYGRAGGRVVVTDINPDSAAETAEIIRKEEGQAVSCALNATDPDSVGSAVALAIETYGSLDVLHNNVGIGKAGDPAETSVEDWRRISDANLLAVHVATQAVVPQMKKQRAGVLLTTSTIGSIRHIGTPHFAYGATKAAANQYSRLAAVEYAPYGIRANAIIVGMLNTPRIRVTMMAAYGGDEQAMIEKRNKQVPLGFMGDAWDVAHAATFLASDRARYISGTELVIDGALTATMRA